jgi:hypothetical protein
MLPETLLRILLFCDWSMISCADLLLAAGKIRKNALLTGSFRCDFTGSQVAFSKCQNRCFKVFEAGHWKDFQN